MTEATEVRKRVDKTGKHETSGRNYDERKQGKIKRKKKKTHKNKKMERKILIEKEEKTKNGREEEITIDMKPTNINNKGG